MNADHPCHDTGVDPESRVYTITAGGRSNETDWSKRFSGTWPQLCAALTTHKLGPKDGSCYVPGVLNGPVRNQDHVAEIHAAVIDLDAGNTLEEIDAALARKSLAAAIASTHSNLTTTTKLALKRWRGYQAEHPDGTPADFLVREKGKLPRVAEGAEILSIDEAKNEVTVKHAPCPKYRVVIPLAKPWRAVDYPSQGEAVDAWRVTYCKVGAYLGLPFDEACARLQMYYFMPRCQNDGAAPESRVLKGRCLSLDELEPACGHEKSAADIEIEILEGLGTKPGMEAVDADGVVTDLLPWAAKYAKRFEIATAIATRRPDVLTDGRSRGVRVGIRCPFEDEHSNLTRDGDTSTVVVNASDIAKAGLTRVSGFGVFCLHNGCSAGGKGRDRLEYVAKMLADGWLSVEDLTDPDFLIPEPEAEAAKEEAHADPGADKGEDAPLKPPLPYQQGMSFLQQPPRAMLMKRLLGLGDLSIWYGAPKSGKSFLVTDATLAVAAELETWFDHRVKHPGLVIYCVLEGSGGFGNRLNAWRIKHGRDIPDNFVWVSVRLSFLSDPTKKAAAQDVQKLLALVRHIETTQGRTCRMVVVDTCARAMDGADENSVQDMTKFVNQCALIQDLPSRPHCAVVHHENASGTKPRGSTALLGAGDVFIRIQKLEKGRVWSVVWGKDVEEGAKHGFALETVLLGQDEDGDLIDSCVITDAPVPADTEEGPGGKKAKRKKREEAFEAKPPRRPRGQNQQLVLNALRAALFDTPDARPEGIDAPPGAAVVTRETWWAAARDALPHEDEKKARDAFRDAVEGLVGTGFVGHRKRKVFWELGQPE